MKNIKSSGRGVSARLIERIVVREIRRLRDPFLPGDEQSELNFLIYFCRQVKSVDGSLDLDFINEEYIKTLDHLKKKESGVKLASTDEYVSSDVKTS